MSLVENSCGNCNEIVEGDYCSHCGQKNTDRTDRSILKLLIDFVNNIFFLDNRFWVSLKTMFISPGEMTTDFLSGRRKKYVPPITLFLAVNVLYFFLSPLTDYSLSLYDQTHYQYYSPVAKKLVQNRLKERTGWKTQEEFSDDFKAYAIPYQVASDNISKSVMILNVPLIALFVYLISYRRWPFYFDSLLYALHFFTVFLISVCIGHFLDSSLTWMMAAIGRKFTDYGILLFIFVLVLPVSYAVLSFRKFLNLKWSLAVPAGIYLFIALGLSQFAYRGIIFFLTFWTT